MMTDARQRFIALVFDALEQCDRARAEAGSIADVHAAYQRFNDDVKHAALEPVPAKPTVNLRLVTP